MWIECNKYFFMPLCFSSSVQIPIIRLRLIRIPITNILQCSVVGSLISHTCAPIVITDQNNRGRGFLGEKIEEC